MPAARAGSPRVSDGALALADHEFADGGRATLAEIERTLPSAVTYVPDLSEAERWELAEAHERIMVELQAGRFDQVADAATRLMERWPTFIPARNNAAEAQFHLGRLPEAIAIARETVGLFPDNAYALASLIRFLALGGREDEGCNWSIDSGAWRRTISTTCCAACRRMRCWDWMRRCWRRGGRPSRNCSSTTHTKRRCVGIWPPPRRVIWANSAGPGKTGSGRWRFVRR